jgi:glucosamine--fructose-6-phosphate aminotransferase (isomerizing)
MTDMIAAEPHLARRLLERLRGPDTSASRLATAIREAASAGSSVIVIGCGTSEHAAIGTVEIVRDALATASLPTLGLASAQAFELSLDPPSGGLVIGISHEGGTAATNAALSASRDAGARVGLITVSERSPAASIADPELAVATGELDTSWCHTVGYTSPLLAAAAIGAHITGASLDTEAVASLMAAGSADEGAAEKIASRLGRLDRLVVIASGSDRAAGRELVLKIEEGAWQPTAYRDLETFLHGHLPANGEDSGLVLVLTDRERRTERLARARGALAAVRTVGVEVAAILSTSAAQDLPPDATPAGRLEVPEAAELPDPVAALLGSATALQLLAERLARARGTNPDPIRRDDPRYREAAEAVEGA